MQYGKEKHFVSSTVRRNIICAVQLGETFCVQYRKEKHFVFSTVRKTLFVCSTVRRNAMFERDHGTR